MILGWIAGSCASPQPEPAAPIAAAKSEVAHAAWKRARRAGFEGESEALTPAWSPGDWPTLARHFDEFHHRAALTLPERYAAYLRAAAEGDAGAAYLAGRLGGEGGDGRLRRSVELDPTLAWGFHGVAWRSYQTGVLTRAIAAGRRALDLARDPLEVAQFAWAMATYLRARDRANAAIRVLESALEIEGALALRPAERTFIEALLAQVELESLDSKVSRRGARRALTVIGRPGSSERERSELAVLLRRDGQDAVSSEEIQFALMRAADAAEGAERERTLALFDGVRGQNHGLRTAAPTTARRRLEAAFRDAFNGGLPAKLERWSNELPDFVKDEGGMPLRAELRAVVEAAAEFEGDRKNGKWSIQLGDALIAAGWFREADRFASSLLLWAGSDQVRDYARSLQSRAVRAQAALAAVHALARRIDARSAYERAGATGTEDKGTVEGSRVKSLRALRDEIERILVRHDLAEASELSTSPRIRYGPLGAVLHPGPTFSSEDDAQGLGKAGDEVPGIGELFQRLGRFALVGNGAGQGGPDATVLRLIHVEERSGEHLGRPFRGMIFWCQGADVPSRFGRAGAAISGAALHEGYYIDLEMVEREQQRWDALFDRFEGREAAVTRALDVRGASTDLVDRTEVLPALGAADRMRLAVMRGEDGALTRMTLGKLASVVATHEEGHLCDRARWYPLSVTRTLRVVSLGLAYWFNGNRISQALEERAQLVAVADAHDSRLAWIDLLDAADGGSGGGVTPHGTAYRRILGDLIERLDADWESGALQNAALDPGVRWIDQLHRLTEAELRAIAVRVASRRELAK